MTASVTKLILFANTDWYLYNFRRSLALMLRDAGYDLLLLSPAGPYGQKLLDLGLRWEPLPMHRRSLNPLREAQLVQHLIEIFRRERPALVHGFTIKAMVYGSLAARMAGVPARVSAVDGMGYVFTSNDPKARALRPIVSNLLRLALHGEGSRVILLNPDDVEFFRKGRLVDSSKVRLIPGVGVDCDRYSPKLRAERSQRLRVLVAARLLWDKGLAEYIDAARQLRARGFDMEFLLAGDPDPGNPAAIPVATVEEWVRSGLVSWLGHVDDMAALLATVDIVVLPSYREGLPTGLTEAAACGLPIVTTDVPGCREVVKHDVDGLLVPVKNTEALADAIARLCDDAPLRRRLGEAARAKALSTFDARVVNARTVAVYRELLRPR